ncbi:MAG: hypothetical protein AAF694_19825, partial [Bacteroidota bacterium]
KSLVKEVAHLHPAGGLLVFEFLVNVQQFMGVGISGFTMCAVIFSLHVVCFDYICKVGLFYTEI